MTRKDRLTQQQILAHEGISKLKAVAFLFGAEEEQDDKWVKI